MLRIQLLKMRNYYKKYNIESYCDGKVAIFHDRIEVEFLDPASLNMVHNYKLFLNLYTVSISRTPITVYVNTKRHIKYRLYREYSSGWHYYGNVVKLLEIKKSIRIGPILREIQEVQMKKKIVLPINPDINIIYT